MNNDIYSSIQLHLLYSDTHKGYWIELSGVSEKSGIDAKSSMLFINDRNLIAELCRAGEVEVDAVPDTLVLEVRVEHMLVIDGVLVYADSKEPITSIKARIAGWTRGHGSRQVRTPVEGRYLDFSKFKIEVDLLTTKTYEVLPK